MIRIHVIINLGPRELGEYRNVAWDRQLRANGLAIVPSATVEDCQKLLSTPDRPPQRTLSLRLLWKPTKRGVAGLANVENGCPDIGPGCGGGFLGCIEGEWEVAERSTARRR